jgi:hypothetical protein
MSTQSEDFIKILNQAGVEYVVIGGVAMVAHGSAYVTFDFDVCYRRSKENIEKLCAALRPFHIRLRGPRENLPFQFDAKTIQNGLNFTFTTDIGDIDLLAEVAGIGSYDAVLAVSLLKEVAAMPCRILSLNALIQSKRAAGREKDLATLKELQALKDLKDRLGES